MTTPLLLLDTPAAPAAPATPEAATLETPVMERFTTSDGRSMEYQKLDCYRGMFPVLPNPVPQDKL